MLQLVKNNAIKHMNAPAIPKTSPSVAIVPLGIPERILSLPAFNARRTANTPSTSANTFKIKPTTGLNPYMPVKYLLPT